MELYVKKNESNEKYFDRLIFEVEEGKEKEFKFSKSFLHVEEVANERIIGHIKVDIIMDEFSIRLHQNFHPENSNGLYDSNFRPVYHEVYTALNECWNGGWSFETKIVDLE